MKIIRIIEIHCVKSKEFSNITAGGSLPLRIYISECSKRNVGFI